MSSCDRLSSADCARKGVESFRQGSPLPSKMQASPISDAGMVPLRPASVLVSNKIDLVFVAPQNARGHSETLLRLFEDKHILIGHSYYGPVPNGSTLNSVLSKNKAISSMTDFFEGRSFLSANKTY